MQNERSFDVVLGGAEQPNTNTAASPPIPANSAIPTNSVSTASSGASAAPISSLQDPFATPISIHVPEPVAPERAKARVQRRWLIIGVAGIMLLIGGVLFLISRASNSPQTQVGDFGNVKLSLNKLGLATPATNHATSLRVNGQLQVTNSLVLTPTSQQGLGVATAGQLYYDKDSNKLAYYNGQSFVNVGDNVQNVSNVTNVSNVINTLGNGATAVQLQATAPGTQQGGNFNISGVGQVGTLKTSVIDTGGTALAINPTTSLNLSQITPGSAATLGLTTAGTIDSGAGINGTFIATKATMGAIGGTATSISVFITGGTAGKHIQVGLYDDDGDVPNRPANQLAISNAVTLTPNAVNTVSIPSIALTPNATYWIAFNTDDATLSRPYNGALKASCFYGKAFGVMPDPFGSGPCFLTDEQYSMYVNYTSSGGGGGTVSGAMFSLSNTGQALFQNSSDSTTAFQVQNAAGTTTVFNVDTTNGRIAIGKATAAYKLDIAAGDINLSNGRSVRFAGSPALSTNSTGTTTFVSNFQSGGSVIMQGGSFVVQDADGFHQDLTINNTTGAAAFVNRTDSAAAFQVQNAATSSMLRVDTAGLKVVIGNPAGDGTPVLLMLANKNTAGDPAGAEGAEYYNSTLNSFRCYYNSAWHNCADMEPQHSFTVYDEFLGGQTSFTGQIGSLGWTASAIGANGSLVLNPATPTPSANRPGVLGIQTPASANQGTTLSLGSASHIIAKDNDIKVAVATGAATGQVLRVGLHGETTSTTQPISGVWWEANPATNANWQYCYGNGTTATCAASATPIAANTWVTLEIRVTATGASTSAATFVINGTAAQVSAVTIDTTASIAPALTCYGTNGTAQNCYWDYFQLTGTTSVQR